MAVTKYTRAQLEEKFELKYKGHWITFSYPGYKPVTGRVDEIAVDHHGMVIIQMNNNRYTVSPDGVNETIKVLQ